MKLKNMWPLISIKILYNIHIAKNYVISPNLLQKYTSYVYSEIYKKSWKVFSSLTVRGDVFIVGTFFLNPTGFRIFDFSV